MILNDRILIIGGYGFGNLGDEAVLSVIIRRLRKAKPNVKITVLSYDPQETRKLHNVSACRHFRTLIEVVKSDEVIIGGGEVIADHKKPWFLYLLTCISLVSLTKLFKRGKKLRFCAIGVHPITSPISKVVISKLMNFSNAISVRDISEKEFRELGVRKKFSIVPDPTFDLEPADHEKARTMLHREGVNLAKFLVGLSIASVKNKELNERLIRVVSQVAGWLLSQPNTEVVFISTSNHKYRHLEKDLLMAERLYRAINRKRNFKILKRQYTPQEAEAIIGQMNLFVGMRLHPLIFAYNMKVPLISIAYYKRVISFCKLYAQDRSNLDTINFKELRKKIMHKIGSGMRNIHEQEERSKRPCVGEII